MCQADGAGRKCCKDLINDDYNLQPICLPLESLICQVEKTADLTQMGKITIKMMEGKT